MRPPAKFNPEPFAYHQEVELSVETLTNLGDGLGRIDGCVVMVPFALPGERVRARVWCNRANYSEADLMEVLDPSPHRVEPRCPLFTTCGGCQYQNYAYTEQLRWKEQQVAEALQRIGGLEAAVEPCRPSPREYGYRSKLTPHYPRPRKDGELPIGFLRRGTRAIIDVPHCPIATDAINAALPEERAEVRQGRRPHRRGGTLLLRECAEGVVSDNRRIVTHRVGSRIYQFVAGEFFQNNPFILPEFVDYAVGQAAGEGITRFIDAYCGVGVFAIAGAVHFQEVAGVEVNTANLRLANGNADINGVRNVTFHLGQSEEIFAHIDFPPAETALLVDPPRRGCDETFRQQTATFGPARIVYVSCDPVTQARDVREWVEAGYRITRVQPFDLFPQTRHIENIITLEREPGSARPVAL